MKLKIKQPATNTLTYPQENPPAQKISILRKNEDGIDIVGSEIEIGSNLGANSNPNLGNINMRKMLLKDLKPADYNPRFMTDKARTGLSNSLNEFGLLQPIIYNDTTGNIVGGHQRVYEMLSKGVVSTDVVIVNMSLEKEKAANITLNNKNITGEFTYDLQNILDSIDPGLSESLLLTELKDKENFDEDSDDVDSDIVTGKDVSGDVSKEDNIVTIEFLPEDYELYLTLISKFQVGYKARSTQYKHGLKLGQLLREYERLISAKPSKSVDVSDVIDDSMFSADVLEEDED